MIHGHDDAILGEQDPLRLPVDLSSIHLVRSPSSFIDEIIQVFIGVIHEVVGRSGAKQTGEEVLRVRVVGAPPENRRLTSGQTSKVIPVIVRDLHRGLDSDGGKIVNEKLGDDIFSRDAPGEYFDLRELFLIRPESGLGEEAPGFFSVRRVGIKGRVVARHSRRKNSLRRVDPPLRSFLTGVSIQAVSDRLADPEVIKRRLLLIESQKMQGEVGNPGQRVIAGPLQSLSFSWRGDDVVKDTLPEGTRPGSIHVDEHDSIQKWVVVGFPKGGENELVVFMGDETKGTAADGMETKISLFGFFLGHDAGVLHRQKADEDVVGFLQSNFHPLRVETGDCFLSPVQNTLEISAGRGASATIEKAANGVGHVLGGYRSSVVEPGLGMKEESVNFSIL